MARKPRQEVAGGIFHVFARGNAKEAIYRDDADRRIYLARLRTVVGRARWLCLGYCLMPTHVHLLVETPEANLGRGIQWLHGRYAEIFNARHGRVGHVFQGRYGAVPVRRDEQLLATAAYLALNPVVAGLCRRPEGWPWSSHATLAGAGGPGWLARDRLLGLLSASGGDPLPRYLEYVEERVLADRRASL
jgi:REP element-mobilizing transposase RayT